MQITSNTTTRVRREERKREKRERREEYGENREEDAEGDENQREEIAESRKGERHCTRWEDEGDGKRDAKDFEIERRWQFVSRHDRV